MQLAIWRESCLELRAAMRNDSRFDAAEAYLIEQGENRNAKVEKRRIWQPERPAARDW